MRLFPVLTLSAVLCLPGCKACDTPAPIPAAASPAQAKVQSAPASGPGVEPFGSAPAEHGDQWGIGLQMVLDAQGGPLLAYLEHDGEKPQESQARQITFIGWDAEKKAHRAPRRVASQLGGIDHHPLALARDAQSGTLALAFISAPTPESRTVNLALSSDGGLTWKISTLHTATSGTWPSHPTAAVGGGAVFVAWTGDDALHWARGPLSADPSSWEADKTLPIPGGWSFDAYSTASLAVDAAGQPGAAYEVIREGKLGFWFVRPGSGAPVLVLDTQEKNEEFDLALSFSGQNPVIVATATVSGQTGEAWFVRSSDGGKRFSGPVLIPSDGGRRMGGPVVLAISASGQVAVTFHATGGTGADAKCEAPLLARSKDGASFSTCSPPGAAERNDEVGDPNYVAQVGFLGEKAVVAFLQDAPAPRTLRVWRER